MALDPIYRGAFPDDPAMDDFWVAFDKVNKNDTYLLSLINGGSFGSVTSVGIAMPGGLTVNGSPITTSGTITVSTTLNGILKGDGANTIGIATPGTDYLTPTGDGSGLTGLTKAQVGLPLVENTALSTWAGTTNITIVGTIATGAWHGTTIGTGYGGTNLTSYNQGDILYASAANTLSALAKDTNATRYLSNTGSSNAPAWAQVNIANGTTGVLSKTQGGAGDVNGILQANGSGVVSAASPGTGYQGLALTGTTAPSSTPGYIGQFYIDTNAQKLYVATGISSSADWIGIFTIVP